MSRKFAYADTNIIIRFLTNDPKKQADAVRRFLEETQRNQVGLYICDLTAAEVVYVLQSFYQTPRAEIASSLKAFFSLPGIEVERKEVVDHALEIYAEKKVDYFDAYLAARAKSSGKPIFTFDKDFSKIDGVVAIDRPS